jgi:hypothetical protein
MGDGMSEENSEVVALLRELVGLFKEDLELSKRTVEWTKQRSQGAGRGSKYQRYYALGIIVVLCVALFTFTYLHG